MALMKCCFDSQWEMPEFVDEIAQKCTNPGCCFSCSCMRPRYKRLVDNIFPPIPQDGLVKNNMEKLTFYSLSSPEKLDRIGEYLYQRACRDLSRKRTGFVVIAMEAMDQLLVACHAQTLNLFVESFLRIVQKLLESMEPELQILATQSFVRFANIEEDTPSYHRRYDFFVSKFSSMCHSNHADPNVRDSIRLAGIKGLQGVIRKTVSDDLVENIWEAQHMDKIVPSLLYNMQDSRYLEREANSPEPEEEKNSPPSLAETCIRELVGRASFGHVRCVLKPVLKHLDHHDLWVPNQFAIHTFRIIMFSIQSQYSYAVVESLMNHLDENSKSSPKIRTSIADVLSKIIAIAAEESVGPSVLEIINSLLTHLKGSVGRERGSGGEERQYQDALINALGEFAAHLPDYQKIEIMMFIMSKVPFIAENTRGRGDALLQQMLLKSLLTVGRRYHTVALNTTFPMSFLDPLMRMSLSHDPDMRILVQRILQTLLDRHSNTEKLLKPVINLSELELVAEKCSRSDSIFLRKNSPDMFQCFLDSLELENNTVENIEAVYTTIALLIVEVGCDDTISDFLNLMLRIQDLAISNNNKLPPAQRYNLHAVVACLLILLPHIVAISPLKDYSEKIIEERKSQNASHLLPELLVHYDIRSPGPIDQLLVDKNTVAECLKAAGLDSAHVTPSTMSHRHSWVENTAVIKGSIVDISSELDSATSTPGVQRKYPEEELTFEAMKRVLSESPEVKRDEEAERQRQLCERFRTTPFNELVDLTTSREEDSLQSKLSELFGRLSTSVNSPLTPSNPTSPHPHSQPSQPPVYEVLFPELFAY
ncbi:protein EFR3 homolog cmp44E isoform X2 [Macrosteles quadrilineatus]|uniref:protein EFR3 homolog cmp44E isoform X2 n=1 Tax=Macrosteles quadrilineatus TaxID=74068 RepID=UPI0023E2FBC1|nr:protein EFR3 homolog cmp44E isoform X2 [Macrosteles quadrilineatus]